MRLYHFADAERLSSILEYGLVPHVPDPECMTLGEPVVWLTTAETMMLTAADITWMTLKGCCTAQELDEFKKRGIVIHTNPCRIDVRLEYSKRLVHWATWLEQHDRPDADLMLAQMSPSARQHWYVYFGQLMPWRLGDTHVLNADAEAIIERDFADRMVPA